MMRVDRRGRPAASPRPVPPSGYERYIRSASWRRSTARLAELALSGGRCRLCSRGSPEVAVEVHHNTYERLGRERVRDLCTLCRDCHRVVTGELRSRRYARAMPPEPTDYWGCLQSSVPTEAEWFDAGRL